MSDFTERSVINIMRMKGKNCNTSLVSDVMYIMKVPLNQGANVNFFD